MSTVTGLPPEVKQRIIERTATVDGDFLIPAGWEFGQLLQFWTDTLSQKRALILVKREEKK